MALVRQATLAQERRQLFTWSYRTGPSRPCDYARPRVGYPHSRRGLLSKAHLCLVRERYRLPFGRYRMGPAERAARALERLLAGLTDEELLLHWQGQHLVSHTQLARSAHGLQRGKGRALQPSLRCPREPVPHHSRKQSVDQPPNGRVGPRLPLEIRSRSAPLLPGSDHARDVGL